MIMDDIECVVIGAGVCGIAVARALACAGHEVIVIEAEDGIGTQISSRNSEVVHAGIYYPKDSLMARLCVSGRRMLYGFCAERGVAFARCGKLIVATNAAELPALALIKQRGEANGVEELTLLTAQEARALEPNLSCAGALLSPATGIIDSHAYMLALQGDAEHAGAVFVCNSPMMRARVLPEGIAVDIGEIDPITLRCRLLVNAAGLAAPSLAARIEGMPRHLVPTAHYAKGSYFVLSGRSPFSRLIYPVPVPGGLGVHLTIDLGGQARFGPDVEWVSEIDYNVDASRASGFYDAVRRYWPALEDGALQPGYCGIRPKIVPEGGAPQDFVVQDWRTHGVSGLINLFGIESPGLTAAIALGDLVRDLAGQAMP